MAFAFGCGQPDRGCPFEELCGPPSSYSYDALPGFFGTDAADAGVIDRDDAGDSALDASDEADIETDP